MKISTKQTSPFLMFKNMNKTIIPIQNDIITHAWKAGNVSNIMGSFKPQLDQLLSDHVK